MENPESTQTFQLSEAYYKRLQSICLTSVPPMMLVLGGATIYMSSRDDDGVGTTIFVAVLLGVLIVGAMWRTYARQVAQGKSFLLTIHGDALARSQNGWPTVRLRAHELRRIVETPGRGLALYTDAKRVALYIPETLRSYDACKSTLSAWAPMETKRRNPLRSVLAITVVLAMVAAAVVVNTDDRPDVVAPLGAALVVLASVGFWRILTSPNFDKRAKRRMWVFPFVIADLIVRVLSVLHIGAR